jgi:hypothetical protein
MTGLANAAMIASESNVDNVSALPASLLSRVVASLFDSGAIVLPNGSCVLGPSSVEVVLLASGLGHNKGSQRMRLQMVGKHWRSSAVLTRVRWRGSGASTHILQYTRP